MERLHGESLRYVIVRDGRLDPEQVIEIAVQLSSLASARRTSTASFIAT